MNQEVEVKSKNSILDSIYVFCCDHYIIITTTVIIIIGIGIYYYSGNDDIGGASKNESNLNQNFSNVNDSNVTSPIKEEIQNFSNINDSNSNIIPIIKEEMQNISLNPENASLLNKDLYVWTGQDLTEFLLAAKDKSAILKIDFWKISEMEMENYFKIRENIILAEGETNLPSFNDIKELVGLSIKSPANQNLVNNVSILPQSNSEILNTATNIIAENSQTIVDIIDIVNK